MKLCIVTLLIIFSTNAFSQAEGTYEIIIQKKVQKEKARWSLQDWLETKNRNRLMDMWLALNTSDNPFEFFVEFQNQAFDRSVTQSGTTSEESFNGGVFSYHAFASIVGLNYTYYQISDEISGWSSEFLFRILGTSNQNTNLTLSYGLKKIEDQSTLSIQNFDNQFYKVSFTFYLMKYFGLLASYENLIAKNNSAGAAVTGSSTEYQVFIDYGLLRIFGGGFNLTRDFKSGSTTSIKKTGTKAGLIFFF